jgi:2-C-methyl-D-erythritol 4-phosphate cytidylyltransferase
MSMKSEVLGVILLAAGRGTRMRSPIPKAYLSLRGRPLLAYSLEKILRCEFVSEIVVVIRPEDRERLQSDVLHALPVDANNKALKIAHGGEHRQDSALAGVRASRSPWAAVHDAARPFFSRELLKRVFEAARSDRAAIPAVPVKDSVKSVGENGFVLADVERNVLRLAQTPQCFERSLLERALEDAANQGRYFTDEAGAVLAMSSIRPRVIDGEERNIKITTPWDLRLAEALLEAGLAE